MINLFENYNEKEQDLEESLNISGFSNKTVVLNETGFLPNHIISPFGFFINMNRRQGKPLFFNEVSIQKHWHIEGTNQQAEIFEGYKKKGIISYSNRSGDFRIINSIKWLNEELKVRIEDVYDQFGFLFLRRTYSDGKLTLSTYLDINQNEVILFNHCNNNIQLAYKDKYFFFQTYLDFIVFFFKEANISTNRIFYTSLSTPFFISNKLSREFPQDNHQHTLFWQEESNSIPGNMLSIFNSKNSPTKKIVIQNKKEFHNILQQVPESTKVEVEFLGYLYKYKRNSFFSNQLLTVTNSDNIPSLEELIKALPNHTFNIAARTEMSSKLTVLNKYKNVNLFPSVTNKNLEKLIKNSSIYLDINYGNEVDNIIRRAFTNNTLILGFKNTIHNDKFTDTKNIFNNVQDMVNLIKHSTSKKTNLSQCIKLQKTFAGEVNISLYKKVLRNES